MGKAFFESFVGWGVRRLHLMCNRDWFRVLRFLMVFWACVVSFDGVVGQTLVDLDQIPASGLNLNLRRFVQLPRDPGGIVARASSFAPAPGDHRFFVTTHGYNSSGVSTARIYAIDPHAAGGPTASLFMPLGQFLNNVNGPIANGVNHNREGGLKSVAFHPEFSTSGAPGYRKFYTSLQEITASGNAQLPYVGSKAITDMADSVVGEWTVDELGLVDFSSYREVLRVALDWYAHPAQAVGFNPYAQPGDEDYGLLYFSHGDAGQEPTGTGQVGSKAHGKVLRINPLQNGASSYSVPASNPFTAANDPGNQILDEIYALGLRNPTSFSWAKDATGTARLILADIGEWNVEEINLIEKGGNYGWRNREGTFVNNAAAQSIGIGFGINPLPANDSMLNDFIYPAAQYGHIGADGTVGPPVSVRGGYVVQNGSDATLQDQYIFADFPETAKVLSASLADLVAAKTKLANGEPPASLAPATIREVGILFDSDNNPATASVPMSLRDVFFVGPGYDGSGRMDVVFGQGYDGELYILNKRNGWIYLATNTVPASVAGDYNGNGTVDATDYVLWRETLGSTTDLRANGDNTASSAGVIDQADYQFWRARFGTAAATGSRFDDSAVVVPEPGGTVLSVAAMQILLAYRWREPSTRRVPGPRFYRSCCM